MNQKKFGEFIKKIRKENNLTQKELADKYHVTYQAVSKWETGKNMPDITLIKKISEDFNISMESMLEGVYTVNRKKKVLFIGSIILLLALIIVLIAVYSKNNNFEFKTLVSNCNNFNISGSIAYNKNKSAIYITNVKYCGGNDTKRYKKIECVLYESHNNLENKINTFIYKQDDPITLEEFLQTVTIAVDNYQSICNMYHNTSLFLTINAKDDNDLITSYKIPLALRDDCTN